MIDRRVGGMGFGENLTMCGFDCSVEIERIVRGRDERLDALNNVEENIVLRRLKMLVRGLKIFCSSSMHRQIGKGAWICTSSKDAQG